MVASRKKTLSVPSINMESKNPNMNNDEKKKKTFKKGCHY